MKSVGQACSLMVLALAIFAFLSMLNGLGAFVGNEYQTDAFVRQAVFLRSMSITLFSLVAVTVIVYTYYEQTRCAILPMLIFSMTCIAAYNYSSSSYRINCNTIRENYNYKSVMLGLGDIFSGKTVIQYDSKLFGITNMVTTRPDKIVNMALPPDNIRDAIKYLATSEDYNEAAMRYSGKKYILGMSEKLCRSAKILHLIADKEQEDRIKLYIVPQSLLLFREESRTSFPLDLEDYLSGKIVYVPEGTRFSSTLNRALTHAERIESYSTDPFFKGDESTWDISYLIPGDIVQGVKMCILSHVQSVGSAQEVYIRLNENSSSVAKLWLVAKPEVVN